jgi:RHS repeat-associated protein
MLFAPRSRRRNRRRLTLRTALVTAVLLGVVGPATPADAMGFPLPDGADLGRWAAPVVSLFSDPTWGKLPRQTSGTAAGHGHSVSAAVTRAGGGTGRKPGTGKGQLNAYAPVARKVPSGPSAAATTGFVAATSRRDTKKSSARETYFTNADGSVTRQYSENPMNYRDAAGAWQAIDTTLAKKGSRWAEKSNSIVATFGATADASRVGELDLGSGRDFGFGLDGASGVTGSVSGSTVTYAGVAPGVDLRLSPTVDGLKEAIVLHSAATAKAWTFDLDLTGLSAAVADDGSITITDASGTRVGTIPHAYAYDSNYDPRTQNSAETQAVAYGLTTSSGTTRLTVSIDPSWVDDPARVFPITIDPTFSTNAQTTFADNTMPGDHSMDTSMSAGDFSPGGELAHSFLAIPTDLDGSGVTVSAASLHLYDTWASTCTAERFDVSAVTAAWTPTSVLSYPGPAYGASIGNLTPTVPNACANTAKDRTVGDWVSVTLATATVQGWANGTVADHGLAIYSTTNDSFHWKKFDSANAFPYQPYLSITTTGNIAPQVDSMYPQNAGTVSTLTPELTATGHDMDNSPTSPVKFDFTIDDSNGALVVDSGLIAGGDWIVPSGPLRWGQQYEWTVRTYDGSYYSNEAWNSLTVEAPEPPITSNLSQNSDGLGVDPSIQNYTTSVTDANVATAGPPLEVARDYNSRDPRSTQAFGAGWSTILDAKVTEQYNTTGAVSSVVVTYPDGSDAGYGRNADGTFGASTGRASSLIKLTPGYELIDMSGTTYTFGQALGSGVFGISSVADSHGRAVNLTWTGSQITSMTSTVSGRSLYFAWSTPSGATYAHVQTVTTDPAVVGVPGSAYVWTYAYGADRLTGVCPPGAVLPSCTQYTYTSGSPYETQVLDDNPHSYWTFGESSGSIASSAVIANEGSDNATYQNVTLGQPGPLAGSTATAASFNGTTSYVQLQQSLVSGIADEAVSLWFKTSVPNGVLFSSSNQPLSVGFTLGNYTPSLYVGSDGKLVGEFWDGTATAPMESTGVVDNGAWHHVVLSSNGTGQSLYLDGVRIGSKTNDILIIAQTNDYIGAGFIGGSWPDEANAGRSGNTGYAQYFNGSIADAAFFTAPLAAGDVTTLYNDGTHADNLLATVVRPSGKTYATMTYDSNTSSVTNVVDGNGGTWAFHPVTVSGSSQVYRSSVMGAAPQVYYRLGDTAGAAQAYDEVHSGYGTYTGATLGAAGPFTDETAAGFNGTSSYVTLPANTVSGPAGSPQSVGMWFKTSSTNGILFSYSSAPVTSTTATTAYMPALYVGNDGKLQAEFYGSGQIASTAAVNDGKWHNVVLTSSGTAEFLYIDGAQVATRSGTTASPQQYGMANDYIGAGLNGGSWADTSAAGRSPAIAQYFNGTIGDFAYYHGQLSGAEVAYQYQASQNSGGLTPVTTVTETDPGNHTLVNRYDPQYGNRILTTTDGRGGTTTYGYDSSGFQATVTDPDGDVTSTGHDADGNVVSKTTCQNQQADLCSTTYSTFKPNTQGVDVAAHTTATASTTYTSGTWAIPNAIDGVTGATSTAIGYASASASSANTTVWYQINFGALKTIDQVDLYPRADAGYIGLCFPQAFTIQVSANGTTWTTVSTQTNYPLPTTPAPASFEFTPTAAQYVKVNATTIRSDGMNYHLEFAEVTALNDRPDPTVGEQLTQRDGRSASATDNTYLTTLGYDGSGDMTSEVGPPVPGFPSGRTTTFAFTDGTSVPAADSGYAPAGLPYQTVTPGGATTTMYYNHNGDVAKTVDPDGLTSSYTYDNLGRVIQKLEISDTFPAGLKTTYAYDGQDRVVAEVDPSVLNRVSGANHTADITTVYDLDGNVTSQKVSDDTGGDTYRENTSTYNAYDQVSQQTDADGNITSFTYDAYGNVATETDPNGVATQNTYDADGNLLTEAITNYTGDPTNPIAPTTLVEESKSYDPDNRLAQVTNAMGFNTDYTYTDDGRIATITRTDQNDANPYVQQAVTYDAAGNQVQQVTNNGATVTNFTYDAAGRNTQRVADPSGVDRITTLTYTPDDNVAQATNTSGAGGTQITSTVYDAKGHVLANALSNDPTVPVDRWLLNQSSGTTVPDSTGDDTATASSGVTWTTANGGAAVFNGAASITAGPSVDTGGSFTVSAWVDLTATSSTSVAVAQYGKQVPGFDLRCDQNGKWAFARWNSDTPAPTTKYMATSNAAAPLNTWTHLVGVDDATTGLMTLYVNGVAQTTTATDATPFSASGNLVIGRGEYTGIPGTGWTGDINDVQVYPSALTAAQISAIYARTAPAAGATVVRTSETLDQRGLPTSSTDANGNVTTYAYDEAGHAALITEPTVNVSTNGGAPQPQRPILTHGYNTFGELAESENADNHTEWFAYDAAGQVTMDVQPGYLAPNSSTTVTPTTVNTYDGDGNLRTTTDPLNRETTYVYDQLGDRVQETDPNGAVSHATFDYDGDQLTMTDPTGAQTQATYDYLGRRRTETVLDRYPTPTSSTTTYSYTAGTGDPGGAWLSSTATADETANGTSTSVAYDNLGEAISATDPVGDKTTNTYDFLGRPIRTTAPDNTYTTMTYTPAGQVGEVDRYDASNTRLTSQTSVYDANGDAVSATDPNGHVTTFAYDALGRLTGETQPVDATTSINTGFGYDADGNRTSYTDGRGNTVVYKYNSLGLLESQILPATATYTAAADSTSTTSYDADGEPVEQDQPGGVVVTAGFDTAGNMTSQSGSGAEAATASRTIGYDLDGRVTSSVTSAAGSAPATSESYGYNDRGELLSASGSGGSSTFGYEADGLLTTRADAAGSTTYTYDVADRLKTLSDPVTGTTATYSYNIDSQVSAIAYGSGDGRALVYDTLHRLHSDTVSAGSTPLTSITYGYDNDGNLMSKATTGVTGASGNTYTYDYANRLKSWNNGTTNTPYEYDLSGNRTRSGSNVYTYDARDELTGDGVTSYTYTARGTMSSAIGTSGTTTYQNDAYGQTITAGAASYVYDASGRVLTGTSTGRTWNFAYSGMGNTVASDGSDTYTRDPGDALFAVDTTGGGTSGGRIAMTDAHTDVVAQFAPSATTLSGSTTYDPLGNVTATTGEIGQLGFQSGWTDPATSAVNMSSRWYNPGTGQFMNRDTMAVNPSPNEAAANPFAYVADDPMVGTDPSGHCWVVCSVFHAVTQAATAVVHVAVTAVTNPAAFVSSTASWISHGVSDLDSDLRSAASWAGNKLEHYAQDVKSGYEAVKKVVKAGVHAVSKCVNDLRSCQQRIVTAAKAVYHATVKRVVSAAHAVNTAIHHPMATLKAAASYVKHHAAAIVSFVASTAVFIGCEAALGAETGGVGAVVGSRACGALAGAVGNLVTQGFKCAQGGKGECSAGSFLKAGATGAIMGALAPPGDAAAGEVLDGAESGLADAALDDGAGAAVENGEQSAEESAANEAEKSPEGNAEEDAPSEEGASCPIPKRAPHSFTGSTRVVMADGTTKAIDQVKVGDRIEDSVPGAKGVEVHTVQRVIVTKTDHDFVDVTVRPTAPSAPAAVSKAPTKRAPVKKSAKKSAKAVVAAVAAGALLWSGAAANAGTASAVGGTLTTTYHHPFYDETRSAFVEAVDLQVGDVLQTPTGAAEVTWLHRYTATQVTYDLTIDGLHTYYVVAGDTPVLVHNDDGCGVADHHSSCGCASGKQPTMANGQKGSLRERNPDEPEWGTSERRAEWKKHYNDPDSPLTTVQRAEVKARGWAGPQRTNPWTGDLETMELSHEPIPFRDGGTETVPRWPDDHAAVDPMRILEGNRKPNTNLFPGDEGYDD